MKTLVVLFSFLTMMALPYAATAQDTQTLRGRVISLTNKPVPDVEVKIEGSSASAYTDGGGAV